MTDFTAKNAARKTTREKIANAKDSRDRQRLKRARHLRKMLGGTFGNESSLEVFESITRADVEAGTNGKP